MADAARLLVFGLGYSARAIVAALRPRLAAVAGTVRSADKAARLTEAGTDAFVFDGGAPSGEARRALQTATDVLVSIPPGEGEDPVLKHHRADLAAAPELRRISYLSTVGVYGDYGGAWVDERTIPHPAHQRAIARRRAEKDWLALAAEKKIACGLFRIAGIYGPGRNPLVNLIEGKAHRVDRPGQVFNRIHVEDIASAVAAWFARPSTGIFNLADDEPADPAEVVAYAASLLGVAPPPLVPIEDADLSPMARSFYDGNRRVMNRRIKEELGVALRYPTYRDGLSAMWRDGTWRGEAKG
ncbi:MAG TPA: SDR family oxidoreductase [Bauldia sp.]|nr:SDR family oxidoreductase [Bauldia sp.]